MNRPARPAQALKPEAIFNITVSFKDGEPDLSISEVLESEVVGMYQTLGVPESRMRLQPRPGFHYFTAADRIKHITAELITETSN